MRRDAHARHGTRRAHKKISQRVTAATTLVEGCNLFIKIPEGSYKGATVMRMRCRRKLLLDTGT